MNTSAPIHLAVRNGVMSSRNFCSFCKKNINLLKIFLYYYTSNTIYIKLIVVSIKEWFEMKILNSNTNKIIVLN